MSAMLDWALYYARLGWAVFPLVPGTKSPFKDSHGSSEATTDPERIRAWWAQHPDANIATRPSAAGLYVYDVDPRNGGDVDHQRLQAERGPIDSPLRVNSPSGGWHLYLAAPPGQRYDGKPAAGIDGKYNGYAVLPPSVHPNGGRYTWAGQPPSRSVTAAPIPGWLVRPAASTTRTRGEHPGTLADVDRITAALDRLDPDDYYVWAYTMASLRHWEDTGTDELQGVGYKLCRDWSARSDKHDDGVFDDKWHRAWHSDRAGARTLGSLLHDAGLTAGQQMVNAAAAFASMPAEQQAQWWTTESVDGFRGTVEPGDVLAELFAADSFGFSEKWSAGKWERVIPSVVWSVGGNCQAALEVMQAGGLEDSPWLRALIVADAQQRTEWKTITPERKKWHDVADIHPAAEVTEFEDLHVAELAKTTNDHMKDAQQLQHVTFQQRLASFEGAVHWWTGCRWAPVSDALLRRHTGRALNTPDSKLSSSRIAGTVAVLRDQVPMMGQIDPPSLLVPFVNGVLDMATGEVAPHAPGVRNSRIVSVPYTPAATCDQWSAWLADIFETDRGRVALLQEVIGWCMCSDNLGIQKAVTLIGVSRAGKGTILGILSRLIGSAAGAFQLGNLIDDKVLAGMRSKGVVIDYDAASPDPKVARQVTGRFKAITANEPLSIQMLYTQEPMQVALNCKLILAANSVPTLWDDSGAAANRWVPLVFDKQFAGVEDTDLQDRLATELEGIAVWAIEGLRRLMTQRRFTMPVSSRDELDSLVDAASPLDRFIDECCKTDAEARCKEADVWHAYESWTRANGMEAGRRGGFMKAFRDAIRGKGAVWKKSISINGRFYRGFSGVTAEHSIISEGTRNVYKFPQISPPEL